MALDNLISIEFTANELEQLDTVLGIVHTILAPKVINLTPLQRQQYGSVAEQNKLFINKAKEYMDQYPQHIPAFLDYNEFKKDHTARQQIESRLMLLSNLAEQLSDTKILLDHDNYFNALSFYRNIKFLSGENVPGTNSIHAGLKQFFSGGFTGSDPIEPEGPDAA